MTEFGLLVNKRDEENFEFTYRRLKLETYKEALTETTKQAKVSEAELLTDTLQKYLSARKNTLQSMCRHVVLKFQKSETPTTKSEHRFN